MRFIRWFREVLAKSDEEIAIDLEVSLADLYQAYKWERTTSYKWLRCTHVLFHRLQMGSTLRWRCPDNVFARPLRRHERRRRHPRHGRWVVVDRERRICFDEVPPDWEIWFVKFWLDQCSVGRTGTSFAIHFLHLLWETGWDLYHLLWNAVKRGVRGARGRYERSLLLLQVRCNYAFGPWGEGGNKYTRATTFNHLFSNSSPSSDWFERGTPQISFDLGVPRPRSDDACRELFQTAAVAAAKSHDQKGPEACMGRWFSIVPSLDFHDPHWTVATEATALYIQRCLKKPLTEADFHLVDPAGPPAKNARAEVKSLREGQVFLWMFIEMSWVEQKVFGSFAAPIRI